MKAGWKYWQKDIKRYGCDSFANGLDEWMFIVKESTKSLFREKNTISPLFKMTDYIFCCPIFHSKSPVYFLRNGKKYA